MIRYDVCGSCHGFIFLDQILRVESRVRREEKKRREEREIFINWKKKYFQIFFFSVCVCGLIIITENS